MKDSGGACFCVTSTSGRKACVDFAGLSCPVTDECNTNDDCGAEARCVVVSGCCQSPNNLCAPKCGATSPAARSAGSAGGRPILGR